MIGYFVVDFSSFVLSYDPRVAYKSSEEVMSPYVIIWIIWFCSATAECVQLGFYCVIVPRGWRDGDCVHFLFDG